ncbi:hypothetical protein B0H66DRAFT_614226 [Apodospora peruviana]|uniref:Oxidase ustYa n=1 Tax=Apodospora peruviana TaxID=516989 RepID=A0AAE0HU05_9PEZI|nr:hypothetical protein B0H66DRAFT_614226 [Apodospora peruviana]
MAARHHDFAEDIESASFLPDQVKERVSEDDGFLHAHNQRWRPWHLILYALIVVISFALGRYSSFAQDAKDDSLPLSQSMIGRATVPHKTTIFKPEPGYNDDPFGPDMLQSPWHLLAPPGKGHIRVDDPSAWNISGGYPLNDTGAEEYTLSVFHQLHCLATIKSKMSRLQDWYEGENDKEYLRFSLGEEYVREEHVYHCFDYIRQAIMCAGDTALEKARTVDGKVVRGVDGWGAGHYCRDWDVIFRWAEEHRSGDLEGID